ncbi:uncharacterized protein LOC130438446 [Triplophysa dalaica]|uniref:uncharacterized protein LOC130438446 n=1 Tax=Triplophysa dalaica TaxID=1582913 RepID=UPI0024DFFDF8|nr:uncharacterized protein LOC130438446 [Triplophysa dalaica]XP_056626353.1 uncharacterized protein LOC130438446 [Triplophysa dalaica]
MIASQVYEEEVSKFLKIKTKVLGVLEILVGIVAFVCVLLNGLWPLIVAPVLYILTGFLTFLAASKRNLCLVRTSQTFSFINIFVTTFPLFWFGLIFFFWNVSGIVLMVSCILVLVFSVVVASTSCSCCYRPKSRSVAVSYMSAAVHANSVGLLNQSDPSASPHPVTSIVYILPSAPPPNYSPTTSAPPTYYSQDSTAPPTDYNSVPTSPPPPYASCALQNKTIQSTTT